MFFLPLYDDNPTRRPAYVTWLLILACVGVHLWQMGMTDTQQRLVALQYGMVPALLFGGQSLPPEYAALPAWLTPLSCTFLHGGLFHLGGNMLFLWIFGNNVEEAMGRVRYVLFYVLSGYAAALFQAVLDTNSTTPMIGASGAIAGVLGAYALLYPKANVRTLVVVLIFFRLVTIPAAAILFGWFLMQTISGMKTMGDSVAYFAHIGGFIAGVVLVRFMKRADVPLWQTEVRSRTFEITPIRLPSQRRRGGSVPDSGRPPRSPWDGGSPWGRR